MSIKMMTAVWDKSKAKGSNLLLLLAIADNANDDGLAWPGIETLAQRTRLGRRAVIKQLDRLEKSGELKIYRRAGQHNYYILNVGLTDDQRDAALNVLAARVGKTIETLMGELFSPVNPSSRVNRSSPVNPSSRGGEPQFTGTSEPQFTRSVIRTIKEPSSSIAAPKACDDAPPMADPKPPRKKTPQAAMFEAVCMAFGYDWHTITKSKRANVGRVAKELLDAGATPDDIPDFYAWCRRQKWSDFTENAFATRWDDYKQYRAQHVLRPVESPSPALMAEAALYQDQEIA